MLRRSSAAAGLVAALCALGCSDEVEPPPRGGLQANVSPSLVAPDGTACPSTGHSTNIGTTPPSGSNPGTRVEDGNGATVGCSVSNGEFNGKIAQGSTSFSVRGSVAPGGTGTATAVYYDGTLLMPLESSPDEPCIIDVSTPPLEVANGRLWARFDCPLMERTPNSACRVNGFFIMEKCN